MASVAECIKSVTISEDKKWHVFLSKKLFNSEGQTVLAMSSGSDMYFSVGVPRMRLARMVCSWVGFAHEDELHVRYESESDGEKWNLEDFHIGKRMISVRLARTGTEPFDYRYNEETSVLLIKPIQDEVAFIVRCIDAAEWVWDYWMRQALREAIAHEKPVIAPPEVAPNKKPRKGKPRIVPGELLPKDEREAVKQESDEALRKIMGE